VDQSVAATLEGKTLSSLIVCQEAVTRATPTAG
jgi:hypothetical protein